MFVQRVAIRAFRNLEQVDFEPSQGFNLIEGENGQGKTSLLEAVGMLASLKSFRGAKNGEMIQDGNEQARLSCLLMRDGMERDLKIEVNPRSRRILLHNKPVRQLAELYGLLNLVTFVPEDVGIVRGSPAERRLFFDRMIFASQHAYADEMADYEEALRQRNAILRNEQPSRSLARAFEAELVRHGATVMLRRIAYADRLAPRLLATFGEIFDRELSLTAAWEGELLEPDERPARETLEARFAARLDACWSHDMARGHTTVGPHRDDLRISLAGRDARAYASQGQQRAAVLAFKISEIRLLEEQLGFAPILALDDVSSELDPQRNARLFAFLSHFQGQVFITTTDRSFIHIDTPFRLWRMTRGQLTPEAA